MITVDDIIAPYRLVKTTNGYRLHYGTRLLGYIPCKDDLIEALRVALIMKEKEMSDPSKYLQVYTDVLPYGVSELGEYNDSITAKP